MNSLGTKKATDIEEKVNYSTTLFSPSCINLMSAGKVSASEEAELFREQGHCDGMPPSEG